MTALSNSEDMRIASLLADYTDGVAPLDTLLDRYRLSYHQVADLVTLTDQLHNTLVEVSPSAAFVDSLFKDLVGSSPRRLDWRSRVRTMSPRMKVAAGIGGLTLTAGVLLLTGHSLLHLIHALQRGETPNEAVAQVS